MADLFNDLFILDFQDLFPRRGLDLGLVILFHGNLLDLICWKGTLVTVSDGQLKPGWSLKKNHRLFQLKRRWIQSACGV
jgi:hypothetical protein